mmetsp:Transcript_64311/g.104038  ORF Transcript_64311/g.104038 Transcript_64311/m.104038 type:complete len:208 (-) Transcript_64311:187-810(-)
MEYTLFRNGLFSPPSPLVSAAPCFFERLLVPSLISLFCLSPTSLSAPPTHPSLVSAAPCSFQRLSWHFPTLMPLPFPPLSPPASISSRESSSIPPSATLPTSSATSPPPPLLTSFSVRVCSLSSAALAPPKSHPDTPFNTTSPTSNTTSSSPAPAPSSCSILDSFCASFSPRPSACADASPSPSRSSCICSACTSACNGCTGTCFCA